MIPILRACRLVAAAGFLLMAIDIAADSSAGQPGDGWHFADGKLTAICGGRTVFEGRVVGANPREKSSAGVVHRQRTASRAVEPVHLGYSHGPRDSTTAPIHAKAETLIIELENPGGADLILTGSVSASHEAWACADEAGPDIVRSVLGPVSNRLNRGVFDRVGDWTLSVDEAAERSVEPAGKKPRGGDTRFGLSARGPRITLALRPGFIRNHRGFTQWKPGNPVWPEPICGWCSWAAYWDKVTERDMITAADFVTTALRPYGYTVVQMDDGYQRLMQNNTPPLGPGETVADLWAQPNAKFPHGLKWLAREISRRGLTPGIWVGCYLPPGLDNAELVTGADGKPLRGQWVQHAVNGLDGPSVERAFLQTIRRLKAQGWDYFKIDTIRHVLYDSYRIAPAYWKARGQDPDLAYRALLGRIKAEIGPRIFMLACWGVIPEMAGIPDGCRIGEDVGASWESARNSAGFTARFNFLNGVVWRNDPDYMCLRAPLGVEQARSWLSFVALTGSQLMVSDKPEAYDAARLELMRRVAPPLDARPATLRSLSPVPELWILDIADAGGTPCTVAGRFAWDKAGLPARDVSLAEIGLDPAAPYLVWDFWNQRFVGEACGSFKADKLAEGECRVWVIRRASGHPEVLATNRHIGQGAVELEGVEWAGSTLSGRMRIPAGHPYSVFIHVPDGYTVETARPKAAAGKLDGRILELELLSPSGRAIPWSVEFAQKKGV